MRVNEQWLRQWVDPSVGIEELAEQLTMAGLEVDALEKLTAGFSGVVVGEIRSVEAHPDAEKLRVCQVYDGQSEYQVVCGAPNAEVGLKVPFARVGAELPGELTIEKARLRGVESHGMLCGGPELELSDDDSGLMLLPADAPLGAALEQYLELNDAVIELDITPNRGDCFSVLGVAREIAVVNKVALKSADIAAVAVDIDDCFPIAVEAPDYCPRYCGRVVRNIDISRSSPIWMQEKLRRAGLRSIDAVVDVTNYVLLELGQPMHAFDLANLQRGIVVRLAGADEEVTLLDGQKLQLRPGTLVIADGTGPRALAGIMGGKDSGVSDSTRDILLESAFFTPEKLAGQARRYGLHTDSSLRFERGVDYTAQRRGIERATELLLEIAGGDAGPVVECVSEDHLPSGSRIHLRRDRIRRTLGLELEEDRVVDILQRLGFEVQSQDDGWLVAAPTWRFDMAIEADLLEELARIHGYNRLPIQSLQVPLELKPQPECQLLKSDIRQQLIARDYREVITYSFVAPELLALFTPEQVPVQLANPISTDMASMRTSLWPGLVNTLIYNANRQQQRVRLFETGLSFIRTGDAIEQTPMLAAAICGRRYAEAWDSGADSVDFFDLKGDLQSVLALGGQSSSFTFEAAMHPALHDGQSARIVFQGQKQEQQRAIGWIGRVHPRIQQEMGLAQPAYLFELELEAITRTHLPKFSELSRYPEVRRDIALIVDQSLPADEVLKCIREAAGENLQHVTLFDIYQGKGIEKQRKSLALGLTYRHQSRTLKDSEINESIERVVEILQSQFDALLRD
jgi:phenylalanyl-tRNA synthetase beta chain